MQIDTVYSLLFSLQKTIFITYDNLCGKLLFTGKGTNKTANNKRKTFYYWRRRQGVQLMKILVVAAAFGPKDYAVILPMAGENPDTSFYYFKEDLQPVCSNAIVNFNFTKQKVYDKNWLDWLAHAHLIFITGGDQERFITIVLNTPVYDAIHTAYANGATIAGNSAGSAVMSQKMITGKALTDTS